MSKISFVLNYTKIKAVPPAQAAEFEKSFPTLAEALTFCVRLIGLGGDVLYIIKCVRGVEESVLEGDELARAIANHRPGREAA